MTPGPFNGNEFEIGVALGKMLIIQEQQTEILEEIRDTLKKPTSPSVTAGLEPMKEFLRELYQVLRVTLVLMFLFGLITGQVTWGDLPAIAGMVVGH